MKELLASSSNKRAQMKIQQMAFMLIAVVIFFAMVALVYFSISSANLQARASDLRDEEARELARQIAGTPEFAFTAKGDCSSCIDFDRAFQISKSDEYKKHFWNLDYLAIEKVSPGGVSETGRVTECSSSNYPDCNQITIISSNDYATKTSFVALAEWDESLGGSGGYRYSLGRIHTSQKEPKK